MIVVLSLTYLLLSASNAEAKFITVDKDGQIIWSVLSYDTPTTLANSSGSSFEIKKINQDSANENPEVTLNKENGQASLSVTTGDKTRFLNITKEENELIEVEERPQTSKLVIGYKNNKFRLEQKGIVAFTDSRIDIDADTAKLKVLTSKGEEYLAVLPYEAVEAVLRTKILTNAAGGSLEISEYGGELKYKIDGKKIFNIFNVYSYSVPVTAYVSPANGELLSIDSPGWYKYVGFLLI